MTDSGEEGSVTEQVQLLILELQSTEMQNVKIKSPHVTFINFR